MGPCGLRFWLSELAGCSRSSQPKISEDYSLKPLGFRVEGLGALSPKLRKDFPHETVESLPP